MPDQPLICERCGDPAGPLAWRCNSCGGPLWFAELPAFDPDALREHEWSLWRYGAMLPAVRRFSLGEGMTPLVPVRPTETTGTSGVPFLAKLDYLAPTQSYKDRGVAVMLSHLLAHGIESIVEDSSGNAGAAVAAYAGGIGMKARIFVPARAAQGKKTQIARYGAELVEIDGSRADVTAACVEATASAAAVTYATHAWNPYFLAGQMTVAWELWEQMGRRAPTALVVPVGQGGLLLGLARGYDLLRQAGLIEQTPALYGVQANAYDIIVRTWESGADDLVHFPTPDGDTVAGGIRIAEPVRGREIVAAIRATGGAALRVDDDAILAAQAALAAHGLFVEPTSAAPVAALDAVAAHLGKAAEIVVPLTGSGLKTGA